MERFIQCGKDLGLAGQELVDFVKEESKKEEQKQKDILDKEREDRHLEREMKRLEFEHAAREKELQLEIERAKAGVKAGTGKKSEVKARLPKLPPFNDKQDSMDAYLKRFERFAETAEWDKADWATNLSALLQGKALDVYSRLSAAESVDYDALKSALLKRFQLTEEGFRSKFRTCKAEIGETPQQFVVRLEDYLLRWMEQAKVTESFVGLKDLVLREQFMQASPKSLQVFLKERKVSSVVEMAELAEQYQEAHGIQSGAPVPAKKFGPKYAPELKHAPSARQCYICRDCGHIARDCPQRFDNGQKSKVAAAGIESGNQRGRYISRSGFVGRGGHRGRGQGGRQYEKNDSGNQNYRDSQDVGCYVRSSENRCGISGECDETVSIDDLPVVSIGSSSSKSNLSNMPVVEGFVNSNKVRVLRDSGCSSAVVRRDLVDYDSLAGKTQLCVLLDGTVRRFPVATVFVETPYFTGEIDALCAENPVYDLIIGNLPGVKDPKEIDDSWHKGKEESILECDIALNVQTRAQKSKEGETSKLKVSSTFSDMSSEDTKKAQEADSTLDKVREKLKTGDRVVSKKGAYSWFSKDRGLLYRHFQSNKVENGKTFKQLCVPRDLRTHVMKLAHDSLMAGHLGIKKTTEKILYNFWWPGLNSDITRYCRSCDICQKTFPKGKVKKVPIGELPIIDTPFARVAVDLVGPINPPSDRRNRYILTMVDYASRYPEAVALKQIDTETVAEALLEMFSRVGVPNEILSDMGKQFTSDLMREIHRLLSVRQLTTSPYNPACNGLVEKFNGTLKSMLKKMCAERPKDWDRYIAPLLFAYREAPQESTGFSPFELLYGRTIRGPLQILKELWTKEIDSEETKTTYQYVVDLRNRLEDTLEVAHKELAKNQGRYKKYADKGKKGKSFKAGDKVSVLLPTDRSKLLMHLQGPFEVVEKLNSFDYRVKVRGKNKIYHANLLRKYIERETELRGDTGRSDRKVEPSRVVPNRNGIDVESDDEEEVDEICVAVIDEVDESSERDSDSSKLLPLDLLQLEATEGIDDVQINPELTKGKQQELKALIEEYKDVLTDVPGETNLIEHDIKLISETPVRSKPYPIPMALRESFKADIQKMLKMGIIEPCDSPFASPVVIVKKPDGTNRVCIDYRKVNNITVFDTEPLGNPDYIFDKLSGAKFFSKIDLSKGYWQIKVKEKCKSYTAFVCSEGLFSFNRMPFGMVNSGSSFSKMMRKLLDGLDGIDNFVDDILDFTDTWDYHLVTLRSLFERLRAARLTARPSKCKLGYTQIDFLGHVVGKGMVQPHPDKVRSLQDCKRPYTKTQVRSFLGLVGYYRKFIPSFSEIASCLTDMTKKGRPNKVDWSDEAENAFRSLVSHITRKPILCLPDWQLQFVLRTDASDKAIGSVLLQAHGESTFPVAYASRKLLPRETRYSVIEREGLAIVWSVQKFQCYLYGKEFILETDHAPLVYMSRAKVTNPRIMRWVLALQPYRFRILYIKGSENVGADFMSRIDFEQE